ncbi:MAG TPA: hypothetical protein VM942_03230, partial [Acidimicrobiales bacterium]|nr:hypothetical protein [Acidimicrobiales bacterium]
RQVPGGAVHEPWKLGGGPRWGYLEPIVDHGEERKEALARYAQVRGGQVGGGQDRSGQIREHTTERQIGRPARRSSP